MYRYEFLIVALLASASGVGAQTLTEAPPATRPALSELRPILTPEARLEMARERIDRFVAHVQASETITESARRAVADAWNRHRDDKQPEDFLVAGVAIICEPFKAALTSLDAEAYDKADPALKSLTEHRDPYVSLHSAALLGRSLARQDRLDEAESVLAPLAANEKQLIDRTFLETEVDFLLAYCKLSNLQYDAALAALIEFERQHPDAPDQFRLPARQMLQELLLRQPERLGDVADLMSYAGRRLSHGQAGEPVRLKQDQAVKLLSALIEEAEEQEKQSKGCKSCGGKGCSKCRGGKAGGNSIPSSPANQSMLPGGAGRIGDQYRSPTARPGEVWGQMPPEQRERILQSLRKNFPARYRPLVEQYYRQLAKEQ